MRRIRWTIGSISFLGAALVLTAGMQTGRAGRSAAAPPGNAVVKIDNFSFGPADITITAGTTVTWTNNDDVPHVVASEDKVFKSKALDTDDRFSFTFTKPGTYNYYCAIHPKMTAKIVVQ